jgi:hypothetical protein
MDNISAFAANNYWALLLMMVLPAQVIVTMTLISELKRR